MSSPAGAKTQACKVDKGEVIGNVQAKGTANCETARRIADVLWQAHAMGKADERGALLVIEDEVSGYNAESFTYQGWSCLRTVKYHDYVDETGSKSRDALGVGKCVRGKQIVRWQIVDPSPEEILDPSLEA